LAKVLGRNFQFSSRAMLRPGPLSPAKGPAEAAPSPRIVCCVMSRQDELEILSNYYAAHPDAAELARAAAIASIDERNALLASHGERVVLDLTSLVSPSDLGAVSNLAAASLTVGQAPKVAKRRPSALRPSDQRPLLNPPETANRLGVSLDTLDGIVRDGALAFVNVGRGEKRPRRMFDEHDVDAFIETRKQRCTSTKTASRNSSKRKSGSRGDNIVALQDAQIADRRKRLLGG
jgi:hypothetical protein